MPPIVIDGAAGEGGGQILRTSLALAVVTGRPVRIERIRAGRARPGLQRQHLACVEAAAAVSGGRVEGARLHGAYVELEPGPVRPGAYRFSIGTAGSALLVLQTVLAPLLVASGPSEVVIEGGTHNPMSPPFEFVSRCFAPVLERMGARLTLVLERPGFYPEGGGRLVARIEPAPARRLSPVEHVAVGPIVRRRATAVLSQLPAHIGERELAAVRAGLGWHARECAIEEVQAAGPGNVLLLEVERRSAGASSIELVTAFGEKGVTAERVVERAMRTMRAYLAADVPVGEHLADQLMIPFALAGGGRYRTLALSGHATTNLQVIQRFLPIAIEVAPATGGGVEVTFAPIRA